MNQPHTNQAVPLSGTTAHPAILKKRERLERLFRSWLRMPTNANQARRLFDAMTDYELCDRLIFEIPAATEPTPATK